MTSYPVAARGARRMEFAKLGAFVRRDFLTSWSYRLPFFTDLLALFAQVAVFAFVGLLVDERRLPTYGGHSTTYLEFVAIGLAIAAFVSVALGRVAAAIRNEQLMGTLECLLTTPTSIATIQIGSVVYDLIYVPLRTAVFLVMITAIFGLDMHVNGILPAAVTLMIFIPFVWGLGIASASAVLTFRAGGSIVAFGMAGLTLFSGAYFPLDLLPGWATDIAEFNPVALAVEGMRESLLSGAGWSSLGTQVLLLVPCSIASIALGTVTFAAALRRERRLGTLGLY